MDKNYINSITLTCYENFWLSHRDIYDLVIEKKKWKTPIKYFIIPKQKVLQAHTILEKIEEKHKENFTLFFLKSEKDEQIELTIDCDLWEEFYIFWKKTFSKNMLEDFYTISGKIVPLKNALLALENNYTDIYDQFTSSKGTFSGLPTNKEFETLLELFFKLPMKADLKLNALLKFCNNHKALFKRIESQNILYDYVKKNSENDSNETTFQLFFKDIVALQSTPIFSSNPCYILNINKKQAFNIYHNPFFTDKHNLFIILTEMVKFFNVQEYAKKLNFKNAFLLQTGTEFSEFIIVFSFINKPDTVYLNELMEEYIYQCTHNAMPHDWNKFLLSIMNQFNLQKKLSIKNPHVKNVIKI
jgi:hypothetical protein